MTCTTDSRYTDEALRAYDDNELANHAAERNEQFERVERDIASRESKIACSTLDVDDNENDLGDLAAYLRERREVHAAQTAIEAERQRREREEVLRERAQYGIPAEVGEYIERRLEDEGLPGFEFYEDETKAATTVMWQHALIGVEMIEDDKGLVTNRRVADRVVGAWLALYEHDSDD